MYTWELSSYGYILVCVKSSLSTNVVSGNVLLTFWWIYPFRCRKWTSDLLASFSNLQASISPHFSVFRANLSSPMTAAIRSKRFNPPPSEKESGPGNSRLKREKGLLLAWSGTAPLALQARWLIWFQCLVLTPSWHSTLCHLLLSAWSDVAHVASDWLMGLIGIVSNAYSVHRAYKHVAQATINQWSRSKFARLQTCQYQLRIGSAKVITCLLISYIHILNVTARPMLLFLTSPNKSYYGPGPRCLPQQQKGY